MSAYFRAVNPKNNKAIKSISLIDNHQVDHKINLAYQNYIHEKKLAYDGFEPRFEKFRNLQKLMLERKDMLAETITMEMGKPIAQAKGEIDKSIGYVDYYLKTTPDVAARQQLASPPNAYVIHQPIGPLMMIVPWNFPIWIPFKSGIPPLMMGNPILFKHSPQTPLSAMNLDQLFKDAGFNNGEFQNLFIDHDQAAKVIGDKRVRGLKFTGSVVGGQAVGSVAGAHVKKCCFELGGSDPFIVLDDADIDLAINKGYISRLQANGQACISAKRFIIHDAVYDEFKSKLIAKLDKEVVLGDPLDTSTTIGPLVSPKAKEILERQVAQSVSEGARVTYGQIGYKHPDSQLSEGSFFSPVIMEDIPQGSTGACEEFFGPVFQFFRCKDQEHAIQIANDSDYGLGAAVFSKDIQRARQVAERISSGMLFINDFVARISSVPGGGVKSSGYGREAFDDGLLDFTNRKSIVQGGY